MKRILVFLIVLTVAMGPATRTYAAQTGPAATGMVLDAGNGVSIVAGAGDGQAVYAGSDRSVRQSDRAVVDCYRIVAGVIHLDTAGLPPGEKIVYLSDEYDDYYVLDDDLSIVGTNDWALPLLPTYYLALKENLEWDEQVERMIEVIAKMEYVKQTFDAVLVNDNPNVGGDGYA